MSRALISASSACLPSQLFHCLSAIIAAELGTGEQPLVAVCAEVMPGVGGAAARVDAVGQLAGEGSRLDPAAMHELVLLEDVSAEKSNLRANLTRKSLLGSAESGRTAALPSDRFQLQRQQRKKSNSKHEHNKSWRVFALLSRKLLVSVSGGGSNDSKMEKSSS